MSLTRMLSGTSEKDILFQNTIKKIVPTQNNLKTYSNKKPFSKEFKMTSPSLLNTLEQAGITGIAFDYLLRFMVAKYIDNTILKDFATQDLVCKYAFIYLKDYVKDINMYGEKYDKIMDDILDFIHNDDNDIEKFKDIITGSLYLAKLESIVRGNSILNKMNVNNIDKEILYFDDRDIKNQLYFLCKDFERVFIKGNILKKDSIVEFNPMFNKCSKLVNGADADICIDDVLYDIKTTKSYSYKWKDIAQITSYYLFSQIERNLDVHRIAIYLARYGEIIYFDVKDFNKNDKLETINKIKEIIGY